MDVTKIVAIGIAVIMASVAVGVIIINNNDDKESSDFMEFNTWDDVLNDARGQTVSLGFYMTMDPAINQSFWPHMQKEMKDKYGITVTCDNTGYTGYGPVAANASVAEIEAGKTSNGSYDLIWGDTSAYSAMTKNGQNYEYVFSKTNSEGKQWAQLLPNAYLLKDGSEATISSQFPGYASGSALNFSNGQTMFVYNKDFNTESVVLGGETVKVPYDCVIVYGADKSVAGVIKVASDDDASAQTFTVGSQKLLSEQTKAAFESAWGDCTTAYKIKSVRDVLAFGGAKGVISYGIPTTFSDLAGWVKIYKGQFTYPDFNNAAAVFHTNLLVQAAIYELTWDGNGGWKAADDRAANAESVNNALKDVKSTEDFAKKFGYVYNYLNEIEPYLMPYVDTGTITGYNAKMVGNGTTDRDYRDGTIMLALTTCTSIDSRVDPGSGHCIVAGYSYNAGTFSMSTGCYSDYYCFIPSNSSHVSAAMVVANWLLDPDTQFRFYTQTGNGFNIDTTKEIRSPTGEGLGYTVGDYFNDANHRLYEYTLSLSVDTLGEVTITSNLMPYTTFNKEGWTQYVKDGNGALSKA